MKSRAALQRRIKELEREVQKKTDDLQSYRMTVMEVFDGIVGLPKEGDISKNWVLKQMKRCFK